MKRLYSPIAIILLSAVVASGATEPGASPEAGSKAKGSVQKPAPPPLPDLPEVLKQLQPTSLSHAGEPGAELRWKNGLLEIRLSSAWPLTDAHWEAVASLKPRAFYFNHMALRDADMDRLVALDPVELYLRVNPISGQGAAKFGRMRNLKSLDTHHMHKPTPEAAEALSQHPSLEYLRTAGDFCIEALRAPALKSVELAETAATIARVEELAAHSRIEFLSLYAYNILTVDDACLRSVAKIQTLKAVRLAYASVTYEGGLKHLLSLPQLERLELFVSDISEGDLAQLKAAAPRVHVKFSPMKPDYRERLEKLRHSAQQSPKN
ncbi:MAG: hypothetical protein RLZZ399_750 [Verrucomicrobiota bacterium]